MRDDLVYACIELLARAAAEPRIAAWIKTKNGEEPVKNHPLIDLLERPNPYTDGYTMWATITTYFNIAGNAYIEKVRDKRGRVVELWTMRPDRVKIIGSADKFIDHYEYWIGPMKFDLDPRDVIHFKTRHPLDDYYGLPPLAAVAGRVDLDNWAREFVRAFFQNAGIPAGMLVIKQSLDQEQREFIRSRWRQDYGGPAGWHNLLVIEAEEAEYQTLGLPLGPGGAAVSELNADNEARILGAFGIPPSLIATRLGSGGSTGTGQARESDRAQLWEGTLVPYYVYLGNRLTAELAYEIDGVDRLGFDLSTVQALQEDQDARHARIRSDMQAGIITPRQARHILGYAEPDSSDHYLLPSTLVGVPVNKLPQPAQPKQLPHSGPPQLMPGESHGSDSGQSKPPESDVDDGDGSGGAPDMSGGAE